MEVSVRTLMTEIDSLDSLKETLLSFMRGQFMLNQTNFEFSFKGMICPDLTGVQESLRAELDKDVTSVIQFAFKDIATIFESKELQIAGHIMNDLEHQRIDLKQATNQLINMVEVVLKNNPTCTLDFGVMSTNTLKPDGSVSLMHVELDIIHPTSILVLIKLKATYGDRVTFAGLQFETLNKLTYAMLYFTRPYFKSVEQLKQFITETYKVNDLIYVMDTNLNIKPDLNYDKYKPTELTKTFTRANVFSKTSCDFEKLRLGIISNITEEGIEIFRISIKNATTAEEIKNGRFVYIVNDSPELISYVDILKNLFAVHGIELEYSHPQVYELLADLNPNPPRKRDVYYTPQNAKAYLDYLDTFVIDNTQVRHLKPNMELLRKELMPEQIYYDVEEMIK